MQRTVATVDFTCATWCAVPRRYQVGIRWGNRSSLESIHTAAYRRNETRSTSVQETACEVISLPAAGRGHHSFHLYLSAIAGDRKCEFYNGRRQDTWSSASNNYRMKNHVDEGIRRASSREKKPHASNAPGAHVTHRIHRVSRPMRSKHAAKSLKSSSVKPLESRYLLKPRSPACGQGE